MTPQAIWRAAGEAAASTPPGRDRVVDLLRGASLAVVVVGHTLMALVTWEESTPVIGNLLAEIPALQIVTWVLQVMPVFFAAGAIANRQSWESAQRRGADWETWMWGRTVRLIRPVVWFLAVWIPIVVALGFFVGPDADPLARLSSQLLWFLGAYAMVVALTPLEIRLSERGPASVVGLLGVVALSDVVRFGAYEPIALLNFVTVWVMAATLGLVVRDRIDRPRQLLSWALGALVIESVVVRLGPYPLSMVGMPGEPISNMAPPTVALALHTIVLICAVGAMWNPLSRWCQRRRVWHGVCAFGGVAMSLYLWHLSALILVTVVKHRLGFDIPDVGGGRFWAATVLDTAVSLVVVVILVSITAPLEHLRVPWLERSTARPGHEPAATWVAVAGVIAIAVGLVAIAATGLEGFPFREVERFAGVPLSPGLAVLVLVAGVCAVRASGSDSR